MALRIRHVVLQRAECKGVLVKRLGVANERDNEIAAADVVRQIAEETAAEGLIAHVLDDASAVGEGVRFNQLLRRGRGKTLQQGLLERVFPNGVDNGLVREDGVTTGGGRKAADD
jgi:hypothetical protein